jgi:hypothetical protein
LFGLGVPLLFYGLLYRRRGTIRVLGEKLRLEEARSGIITLARDIANNTNDRNDPRSSAVSVTNLKRRASFVGDFKALTYLVDQFESFLPSRWYMSVCFLLLRLSQTTLMTAIPNQLVQTAVVCCITLGAVSTQRELSPYRRPSDNDIALLVHELVFLWVFAMQLRCAGLFQRRLAAIGLGVWLCFATLGVFLRAGVLANRDRRAEARAKCAEDDTLRQPAPELQPGDTTMPPAEDLAEGEARTESADDGREAELLPPPDPSGGDLSVWLVNVAGGNLCGAEDGALHDDGAL